MRALPATAARLERARLVSGAEEGEVVDPEVEGLSRRDEELEIADAASIEGGVVGAEEGGERQAELLPVARELDASKEVGVVDVEQ